MKIMQVLLTGERHCVSGRLCEAGSYGQAGRRQQL